MLTTLLTYLRSVATFTTGLDRSFHLRHSDSRNMDGPGSDIRRRQLMSTQMRLL